MLWVLYQFRIPYKAYIHFTLSCLTNGNVQSILHRPIETTEITELNSTCIPTQI